MRWKDKMLLLSEGIINEGGTPPHNIYIHNKATLLAYVAGLVDGEGCIFIHRTKHPRNRVTYSLLVTIANTDFDLLSHIKLRFGGNIDGSSNHELRGKECPSYRWRVNGERAAQFLEAICPYLVLKYPHARIGIELQEQIRARQNRKRGIRLTEEEVFSMEVLKQELSRLNRRGT